MKLEVISLIYKSTAYAEFIYNSYKKNHSEIDGYNISFTFVANDPTPEILDYLKSAGINYRIYNDRKQNDYYLNRVYRCWNYSVESSPADLVCLVNSDMYFSSLWLFHLINNHNNGYLPTSRLVESGKMVSGKYGISNNFGRTPGEFRENDWRTYSDSIKEHSSFPGGLYMPVIFNRSEFLKCNKYPEGNIYSDGIAGSLNGGVIESGDAYFFNKFETLTGRKHMTVFDSVVYHMQEGEKDD